MYISRYIYTYKHGKTTENARRTAIHRRPSATRQGEADREHFAVLCAYETYVV